MSERTIDPTSAGWWVRDTHDEDLDKLQGLMKEGVIPSDTPFRLFSIGTDETEQVKPGTGAWVTRLVTQDILKNATDKPWNMRLDTQAILYGDLPDAAVLPMHLEAVKQVELERLPEIYYRLNDLAECVRALRTERGLTVTSIPDHWWRTYRPEDYERHLAWGQARSIWNILANRHAPGIIRNFEDHDQTYHSNPSAHTRLNRVIERTVFKDTVVLETLQAGLNKGVKGLGGVSLLAIGALLSEEHPELLDPTITLVPEISQ